MRQHLDVSARSQPRPTARAHPPPPAHRPHSTTVCYPRTMTRRRSATGMGPSLSTTPLAARQKGMPAPMARRRSTCAGGGRGRGSAVAPAPDQGHACKPGRMHAKARCPRPWRGRAPGTGAVSRTWCAHLQQHTGPLVTPQVPGLRGKVHVGAVHALQRPAPPDLLPAADGEPGRECGGRADDSA